jgi:DNA modification methylase
MSNKLTRPKAIRLRQLAVTWCPIGTLEPYSNNARTHSKRQIRQIAESIEAFGWTNPVLVDGEGGIIAGHGRVEAAKLLGLAEVPTIRIDDLTEAQKRAYIIADNRLAELAGWDEEVLAIELQFLVSADVDIDVSLTGFAGAEVDLLIENIDDHDGEKEDELPRIDVAAAPVSQLGDLWLLGDHRLLCGDARDPAAYTALMAGETAAMVFSDPPYNVAIDGHVCGLGAIKHREFAMASGEMSEAAFTAFLTTVLANMAAVSSDGSLHYIFMDWRHLSEVLFAGRAAYAELKNFCVWAKPNAGMGSFYRSQHELVLVFKKGKAPHVNNIQLGRFGRNRSNLWQYHGVNNLDPERRQDLALHPTVKPVALVADALSDASNRGDSVLDPFCGSGTTIIAAEKTGRRAFCLEIDSLYIDTALRRWQALTGETAIHAQTGVSFPDMESELTRSQARVPDPAAKTSQLHGDQS